MTCDSNESLGRLIYLTAQDIKNYAEKILSPYGLTLEQLHLLKNMSAEDGMSQRNLGELVNKTPANITRILDRLESKSLILRRSSPDDRRTSQVFLSKEGYILVRRVTGILESFSARLTAGVDREKQLATRATLDKIEQNLRTMSLDLKTESK
jgi:DNA-binding MarR family transcriptional regulator